MGQRLIGQYLIPNHVSGLFNGLAMGFLFFCIFCAYALSFWFGYRLMVDEPENYDVSTMIAVSDNVNIILPIKISKPCTD